MHYDNGPVLTDVDVVAVLWGNINSSVAQTIPGFYTAVTDSAYLDWLSEYNTPTQSICRGWFAGAFLITPSITRTDLFQSDIETELANQIDAGAVDSDGDPYNPNKLYMIHFPSNVTITDSNGNRSCDVFCAFHWSFEHNGKRIRYAVLPDLGSNGCQNGCGGGSLLQNQESAASHEMMEAITDPDPFKGWTLSDGSEIGDACNQQEVTLPGTSYTVQKLWSAAQQACVVTRPVPVSAPHVDSITPPSGAYDGTNWVTLLGSCFTHDSVVASKNGVNTNASLATWSDPFPRNAIQVQLPAAPDGTAGVGQVIVNNAGANAGASIPYDWYYVGPLNVSISPASGVMQGGDSVTITGQGLDHVNSVTFGGVPSTNVFCSSATSCVVATPPHDPGSVSVVVSGNGSNVTSANNFTYLGPHIKTVTPSAGPVTGGTTVTVAGTAMAATSQTTFQATAMMGNINVGTAYCFREGLTDGSCSFTTPAVSIAPGTVDVRLTINNVTGTPVTSDLSASDQFTFRPFPILTGLSFPTSALGGTTVTGTLTLDGDAPASNATVALKLAPGAPTGVVSFPAMVVIPAGQTSTTFSVTVTGLDYSGGVPITALYDASATTGVLSVSPTPPPVLSAIPTECGGNTYNETIRLAEPALAGGGVVNLTATNAVVPAKITVPAGATTATFQVTIPASSAGTTASLGASYDGVAAIPVSFSVLRANTMALALQPTTLRGGGTATGTVTVCGAPSGASVALASTNSVASVPASVSVSGSVGTFTVTTTAPFATTSATITATYGALEAREAVTVVAPLVCLAPKIWCDCDGVNICMTLQQCSTCHKIPTSSAE
jgi:hypothetical protein